MNQDIKELAINCEKELMVEFAKIDRVNEINSEKVLKAFRQNHVSESHFNSTTGYGYGDEGRNIVEKVFASVFKAEDALVRNQFISGTHALTKTLFALLRPEDTLLSISGKPYDTLDEVIGLLPNPSSLMSFKIKYKQIDLINNDFDYQKIEETLMTSSIKVIEIQRSKGYSLRQSISLKKLEKVITLIKKVSPNTIIMIDNCYCEFVQNKEPIEVGADIVVGSLIKNLGGGIANNGAYVVGRHDLVELVASSLNVPGEGKMVGPTQGSNRLFLQGLFMASEVVASALKVSLLASLMGQKLGYEVEPKYQDERIDIVQTIIFNNPDKLIKFCEGIQEASAIDSFVKPVASDMPGYQDQVIMASGSFTQGSSIELSCDGPLRSPYVAYLQGSLTYNYGKLGLINAFSKII